VVEADPPLPLLVSRAQARSSGLTDRQIDRRLATGQWRAVRRGVLLTGTCQGGADLDALIALGSALIALRREVVVGYGHAARLWGLPSPLGGWGDPVLVADCGPPRNRDGIQIRIDALPDVDVVELAPGLRVTSAARTVLDCARVLPAVDALAIADAALRRLLAPGELDEAVGRFDGWPGCRQARSVVRLADGRRESCLESWSAWAFDENELPEPVWQVELRDERRFAGRADCWWPQGLAGEADGRAKYALAAAERGGADAARLAEVLAAERAREARMRRAGADVVRWGAGDVLDRPRAADLSAHVRHLLSRRHAADFTGSARATPVTFRRATARKPPEPPPRWLRGR
jgi:hypothetical protein